MSIIPQQLLKSLEGIAGFDRQAFEQVHQSGEQITSIRINPAKITTANNEEAIQELMRYSKIRIQERLPWTQFGYYLDGRPSFTFDPLFHAGCYYVQEASSMFLEEALKQTVDLTQPLKVLDLCAAPGGKSTHLQSLLSSESLLVSNEVIKNRAAILKQNIIKWGGANVIVTNNDPQHFSKLEGFFDVMVVDAPCSGSGLFRKDSEAISEWSEAAVQLCHSRQKRILSDALAALKSGGILIYATCSYSKEEDEDIMDWLVSRMEMQSQELQIDENWNIIKSRSESGATGYRFYPDKVKGEGFFISCFTKTKAASSPKYKPSKPEMASLKEKSLLEAWITLKNNSFLKYYDSIFALPERAVSDFSILKTALNVQYAGTRIGELIRDKLIPDHALAVSNLVSDKIERFEIAYEEAIRYLQKGDMQIKPAVTGWQLVAYKGWNLGWMNALPNRVNNYYPKELRILKRQDDVDF